MSFNLSEEMPELVKQFAMYQRNVKGLSAKTVAEYCMDLRTFLRFIKHMKRETSETIEFSKIPVKDVSIDLLRDISTYDIFMFMNYVSDSRNNISSTRMRKTTSIKSFFRYLHIHEKLLDENPAEHITSPKTKKSLPRFLSLEQSKSLLDAVEGPDQKRDYCMLVLFLNCGLRLSELVSINLSDVLHRQHTIRILGKGNKERILHLNTACLDAIQAYIEVRPVEGVKDKNALFLSARKQRISPKTVQYIVYKYLDKIGLSGPGYSVHKLRHTAATLMYQNNVDIRVLQDILGHENLGTTQIYTHTSNKQMQDAMESNPLANLNSNKENK